MLSLEALIEAALRVADVRDPDLPDQHLTAARSVTLTAGDHTVDAVFQQAICTTLGIDTAAGATPTHAEPASESHPTC